MKSLTRNPQGSAFRQEVCHLYSTLIYEISVLALQVCIFSISKLKQVSYAECINIIFTIIIVIIRLFKIDTSCFRTIIIMVRR